MSDNACKTPLIDLLRQVPADARATYEHNPTAHSNIPYGRLCNEASAEIERLRAELEAARRDGTRLDWILGRVLSWEAVHGWSDRDLSRDVIDAAMKEAGNG